MSDRTYRNQLLLDRLKPRQEFQHRYEQHSRHRGEQLEAFVNDVHEPLEPRIVMGKSNRHDDVADDVRYGNGQYGVQVHGVLLLGLADVQELFDFPHYSSLHLGLSASHISHAKSSEAVVDEPPLVLPEFALDVDDT